MKNSKAPADVAYEALRRAIIERAVEPGTKLPEDALAAQFGISRTPVRAVLARLQAAGLVAGGGARLPALVEEMTRGRCSGSFLQLPEMPPSA